MLDIVYTLHMNRPEDKVHVVCGVFTTFQGGIKAALDYIQCHDLEINNTTVTERSITWEFNDERVELVLEQFSLDDYQWRS